MTTALDIVKPALRAIEVVEGGESPTAEEGADGLTALNNMLRGFTADGIDYAHTEIATLATPVPMPDECTQILIDMLAVRLAREYGKMPSPLLIEDADRGRRYLQGRYRMPKTAPIDTGLTNRRAGDWSLNDWTTGG